MTTQVQSLAHSYERDGLLKDVQEALQAAGLGEDTKPVLTAADLAPLDQFHARGFEATRELAELMPLTATSEFLDIGSGLGGPARYLVTKYGCRVRGIDLTKSYVDIANYLAERTGLSDKASFQCANALALPFEDQTFDAAWTQHVAMNIENRAAFYTEAHRVLKPGGLLSIYDVVAGNNNPVIYPTPWSDKAETSFLLTPDAMRELLEKQGFRIKAWQDHTADGIAWFANLMQNQAAQKEKPQSQQWALSLNIVVGPEFPVKAKNLAQNLKEGRVGLLEAVLEKI